jgi:hypothetical protein
LDGGTEDKKDGGAGDLLNPRFTITNRITAALTQIERARGFLDAGNLSEDWLEKTRSRALLLEAHRLMENG